MARKKAAHRREKPTSAPTPLTGLVAFKLIHLADTISRAATLVYEKQFGLNNSELRAMIALRDLQPLTIADLSRVGRIDKAWVSRSVASLLDRGLVSREAHPTDQRMALIRLTPAGLALTREFEPVAHARQKRLLAGVSQREAFRVIDMLQKNADQLLKEP
ncbi:MarR family winged helix-turn-helix transcriptional regulator [Pseudorhodoplanes sp.]|uniref:MarR family winged helix-turn-helix transcriptional regulator n=1 Tax=Pseudorhodoplanes sp. TaxID=1934341 RepID=UPI002D002512|nr:MarR family transcriptional regulator [Pseudorhodoplanes sp.]HWV53393.1 MarR family transcriptional regulator [Pseudorhodoplanes sp.]